MIFRRIDSKTVNCIITPQDMENHGIRLDDLFERKEQAMEFLHMIVGEAQRRVNFKPDGAVTSMQMTVLPDHSVSLTLSEQSGTQFRILLKKIQQKLGIAIPDNLKKELEKLSEDQKIERLKDYAARVQSGEEREKAAREAGLSSGTGSDVNPAGTSADITLSGKTHGRQMKKEKSAGQAAGHAMFWNALHIFPPFRKKRRRKMSAWKSMRGGMRIILSLTGTGRMLLRSVRQRFLSMSTAVW